MNRNQGSRVRSQAAALLIAVALAFPAAAQGPTTRMDAGHDFVFLAEARPLLVRIHVRVAGKTLQEVHDDFMAHLFRHLDIKGKGYLTKEEAERAPLANQIKSGSPGSIFSGAIGYSKESAQPPTPANADDNKITPGDLSAFYHKQGLLPFQLEAEVDANYGGMRMMMLGGGPIEPTVSEIGTAIFSLLDAKGTGKLTKASWPPRQTSCCAWTPTKTK